MLHEKISGNYWNFGHSDLGRKLSYRISPILEELLKYHSMEDFLINFNLSKGNSIKQKQYNGNLHVKYGLPIIEVNILLLKNEEVKTNLRAFIDTGASTTIVNKNVLLNLGLSDDDFVESDNMNTFIGKVKTRIASGVTLTSNTIDFSPINYAIVGDLEEFDVAIGNDALKNCQLNYDGLSKTFTLKSFTIE